MGYWLLGTPETRSNSGAIDVRPRFWDFATWWTVHWRFYETDSYLDASSGVSSLTLSDTAAPSVRRRLPLWVVGNEKPVDVQGKRNSWNSFA